MLRQLLLARVLLLRHVASHGPRSRRAVPNTTTNHPVNAGSGRRRALSWCAVVADLLAPAKPPMPKPSEVGTPWNPPSSSLCRRKTTRQPQRWQRFVRRSRIDRGRGQTKQLQQDLGFRSRSHGNARMTLSGARCARPERLFALRNEGRVPVLPLRLVLRLLVLRVGAAAAEQATRSGLAWRRAARSGVCASQRTQSEHEPKQRHCKLAYRRTNRKSWAPVVRPA